MQESSFDLNRIHLGNAGFVWNCLRIGWECFDIGDLLGVGRVVFGNVIWKLSWYIERPGLCKD